MNGKKKKDKIEKDALKSISKKIDRKDFLSKRHDYYSREYFFQRLDGAIFSNNQRDTVIYYILDENESIHAGFRADSRRPNDLFCPAEWNARERSKGRKRGRDNGLDRPMKFDPSR